MHPLDRANLGNLISLWTRFGATTRELGCGQLLHTSRCWPHRRWLDVDLVSGEVPIDALTDPLIAALRADENAVVPLWPDTPPPLSQALDAAGFGLGFTLDAMLRPAGVPLAPGPGTIALEEVHDREQADEWTRVASEGFGYTVDPAAIRSALASPGLDLLLARHQDQAVGTALLLRDSSVLGVHMLGVPPAHRRRGHARSILHAALNRATRDAPVDVVLQASPMGRSLYVELGFQHRFQIAHHRLGISETDTEE